MGHRRKWSAAAKFEIALCAIKGEMTLSELCTRYQVAPSQVHAWKKQMLDQGADLFVKNDKAAKVVVADQERKQNKLYEKIGQLTIERDFLKKSASKFPHHKDED